MQGVNKYCKCGCGQAITPPPSAAKEKNYLQKRQIQYVHGHNRAGTHGKHYTSKKPSPRLYRERARRIIDTSRCLINNKHCNGRIEVAHIDQNFNNNDIANIRPLCATHHRILDTHYADGMRLEHLPGLKLDYYISSGKRRYRKTSFIFREVE